MIITDILSDANNFEQCKVSLLYCIASGHKKIKDSEREKKKSMGFDEESRCHRYLEMGGMVMEASPIRL